MNNIQAPKGVPDYFPPDAEAFLYVKNKISQAAISAGYGYVELPVFEDTQLFVRGVGESTDVVSKEMYVFTDRGGRSLALRPEGTAGVMRLINQHGLAKANLPVKLWYAGPFFRAERPQHGRYRQLQQVGIEAVGVVDPALDAEVIAVADRAFKSLGLTQYELYLNSLGCASCRAVYREKLTEFLATLQLDEETQKRATQNPLRVLDDKREEVQKQLVNAPRLDKNLCETCRDFHQAVEKHLSDLDIAFIPKPDLVRGLDYYTRTTFEFAHPLLGAQSGIGGGGRYDGLMKAIGGEDISGIGFGIGVDRTMLACQAEGIALPNPNQIQIFVAALGPAAKTLAVSLVDSLRLNGFKVDMNYGDKSLKASLKAADRSGASHAVLLGDAELSAASCLVKDLKSSTQQDVALDHLVEFFSQAIPLIQDRT
jgi:histidyl-tRNA synthetase